MSSEWMIRMRTPTIGTNTKLPTINQMMIKNRIANGKSINALTVAEVKNSRMDSNSCK